MTRAIYVPEVTHVPAGQGGTRGGRRRAPPHRGSRNWIERRLQALRPYSTDCESRSSFWNTPPTGAAALRKFGKEMGWAWSTSRTNEVEDAGRDRAAVEEALRLYPAERVFLNPDCGFHTFWNRAMATRNHVRQCCGHGRRGPRSARPFVRRHLHYRTRPSIASTTSRVPTASLTTSPSIIPYR